jgi:alkylhydroperoxidase family enzyme
MGFHAPQEAARILGEAIDDARQGQLAARALLPAGAVLPAAPPAAPAAPATPAPGAPAAPAPAPAAPTTPAPPAPAGHSLAGDYVSGVPAAVTDAIRVGAPVPDARLAALSDFARCMVTTRGQPDAAAVAAFRAAGFDDRHALGVVLAIATKTISNYANHLLGTPLDPMMAARAWP